jgi:hypothetical protein
MRKTSEKTIRRRRTKQLTGKKAGKIPDSLKNLVRLYLIISHL